jgi:putative folate metabolism gamma-glutamate ligase
MRVEALRTARVAAGSHEICDLIDASLPELTPGSVLAVTSKVVALCEGRVRDPASVSKDDIIRAESNAYLPRSSSRYDVSLTIKNHTLIPSAGIDESNAGGNYVLWPADPEQSADMIWEHLAKRFGMRRFGVVITDSTTAPLRIGVVGISIAHAGFAAINNFVGEADLFGRPLAMTQANVANGLAAAAVVVMGEAAEQTPLALLSDLPFVSFQERTPTPDERNALVMEPADDLYAPLLGAVAWEPGGDS